MRRLIKSTSGLGIIICCMMLFTITAFAYSYGSLATIDVKNDSVIGTNKDLKETSNTSWNLYVASKTMYTTPSIQLVNNLGKPRGSGINVASDLPKTFKGLNNTGTIGSNYYPLVTPSIFQIGWDSIRFKISAD